MFSKYAFLISLLLSAATSYAQTNAVFLDQVSVNTSCFCGLPMLEESVTTPICSLQNLPDSIQRNLVTYLLKRVGPDFYSHLRVVGGRTVDMTKLAELDAERNTDWHLYVGKYSLCFAYRNDSAGIGNYISKVDLDERGRVIKEIGLPDIALDPSKYTFISIDKVREIVRKAHIPKERIANRVYVSFVNSYDHNINSILWKVSSRKYRFLSKHRTVQRELVINAHTGEITKYNKYKRWVKNDF